MQRHYGMDWLRIGAFALLILYHIGMVFVPWGWHVKSAETVEWATIPMYFTNGWRLALLFVVSGYATGAMLAKRPGLQGFLSKRSARLLVPLVFGVVIVVPLQPWIELVGQHGYRQGFLHFWVHDYFRFGTLAGIVLPTWQHLWFVAYLWAYTVALAGLLALPGAWRSAAARTFDTLFASPFLLLALPVGWIALRSFLLWPGVDDTHALVDDAAAHWIFFPAFLFGFALLRSERCWTSIRRSWRVALALGLAGFVLVAAIEGRYPGDTPAPQALTELFRAARAINAWAMVLALLGLADRVWNRDHRWRATLNEAVFPFYIVHQTLIVGFAWLSLRAQMPDAASFPLLVAATALGCWLFYRLGRDVPGLRLLIGLRGWRPPSSPARRDAPLIAG